MWSEVVNYASIEAKAIHALPIVQIVSGEVFATGGGLKVAPQLAAVEGVSLEASDVGNCVAGSEERVFAGCLLSSAPSRVSEDVDIGSPEGEALGLGRIIDCAGFDPNGASDSVPEEGVEGGCTEDDLREAGGGGDGAVEVDAGADASYAVEGLAPPLVGGDAEAGDGRSGVDELGEFFLKCESGEKIFGSLGDGEFGVAEWVGFGGRIGPIASEWWVR